MDYYIIAGEASGDLHAANLMRALRQLDPAAGFRCWGGDLMKEQGGVLVRHYRETAYMGLTEVLAHLPAILRNFKLCKQDLLEHLPDALILVDFPGFNLRIAEFAKKNGIKVFYYISPKIWAWNQKRVFKIKRSVDKMFCILPFEVDFYRKWGVEVEYVGNPLMDAIAAWEFREGFRDEHGFGSKPLVALLPGSRKQEVARVLPEMLKTMEAFGDVQPVIAGAPSFAVEFYSNYIEGKNVPVIFNRTYDLLHHAEAALVTSGTATLETALLNIPQVVLYKASPLTVAVARKVLKIGYISLVNLIAGKEVVRELIQEECNPRQIGKELRKLLYEKDHRQGMLDAYRRLQKAVGGPGASRRAAEKMIASLSGPAEGD